MMRLPNNRPAPLHSYQLINFKMAPTRTNSTDPEKKTRPKSEIGSLNSKPPAARQRRNSEITTSKPTKPPEGRKSGEQVEEIDVCDPLKPQKKKANTTAKSKDGCPCSQSLGDYWLILCSNTQCSQRWHTLCANLPGHCSEDMVNSFTESGWLCPWCHASPYPRPTNHPVKKQEASLLSEALLSTLCETVRDTLYSEHIRK